MSLQDLLRNPEGKTLEFKRDLSSPKPILRTLVAFANSAGGQLVIGVTDGERRVIGVASPLDRERHIANLIADSIHPPLLAEIEIIPWRKTQVLMLQVHPSSLRPHHVKAEGAERGTYVRLGSTNRHADAALINELSRRIDLGSHDEQPLPTLNYEAIDFVAASQYFSQYRTLRRQDLRTLGLIVKHQGRERPTVGGMILFGKDRLTHFPDAWIQVGYFSSPDKSRLVDHAELRDYPVLAIEQAIGFVERNTRMGADIGRLQRRDQPSVPPVALREALVNAVVHADYSQRGAPIRVAVFDDRIEVENPGILLPGLTVEELQGGVSRLRNHVIARAFKELRLIEQWGSGIQKMLLACSDAGLRAPQFIEIGLRFRVILHTRRIKPPTVDNIEQRLITFVQKPSGRSTADIAAHIGLTPRATQLRLNKLRERGLVIAIGSGPKDPRKKWVALVPPSRARED
ncbi:MAG: putative DNA binding domain-containing protein [Pseudomonadales bacterium]|jgi:predicted HTH transcriptional regulator|nr:putative DNA binding domain-containing protein [Pseudomonadales bacterium]